MAEEDALSLDNIEGGVCAEYTNAGVMELWKLLPVKMDPKQTLNN